MTARLALSVVAAPLILLLVAIVAVLGAGASQSGDAVHKPNVPDSADFNEDAVPAWAREPLRAAAAICPEITANLLAAQDEAESNWNPLARNANSGAIGLAQFMPETWKQFGRDGDGDGRADPRNGADAIISQAHYMCHLVRWVKDTDGLAGEVIDLALAAYNAGPGNVKKYGTVPPYQETRTYITKIRRLANTKYAAAQQHPTPAPVEGTGRAAAIIAKAAMYVGNTPYAWGGGTLNGPGPGSAPDKGVVGFDCSSLVRFAFHQGTQRAITLPRTSGEQWRATRGQAVAVEDLQPGDLLFWGRSRIHHVALYVGNGRMIEAPQSGRRITETKIRINNDFAGATRVLGGPLDAQRRS
ncbi:transglycosylase TgdA [Allokutzneria multivorans]|uniref:Transglycosylase TgdA n=1 Tax=Allokutzneria multivorans TaxID=1142134 RepID=A0ABP7SBZ0_9PSEU